MEWLLGYELFYSHDFCFHCISNNSGVFPSRRVFEMARVDCVFHERSQCNAAPVCDVLDDVISEFTVWVCSIVIAMGLHRLTNPSYAAATIIAIVNILDTSTSKTLRLWTLCGAYISLLLNSTCLSLLCNACWRRLSVDNQGKPRALSCGHIPRLITVHSAVSTCQCSWNF